MSVLSNGFISASTAGQNSVADIAVHQEVTAIEAEILTQSNLGFLSVEISDTPMTSVTSNSPITITNVNSTAVTSGNTLNFVNTTNVVTGMNVSDYSTPSAIGAGIQVMSLSGTQVTLTDTVSPPGVLNGDIILFSNLTLATTASMLALKTTLWFADTSDISVGMVVQDLTTSGLIPPGTTVVSIGTGPLQGSIEISHELTGTVNLGDSISFSYALTAVSTGNSNITVTGSELPAGTPVTFSSSGNLPTPLVTDQTYYLVSTGTTNVYEIASTKQNALLPTPVTIALTSIPAGTNYMTLVSQSFLYFMALSNYYFKKESRIYTQQMDSVINHFMNLGYNIERRQNQTANAFYWKISW